jgi:Zn-dependent protease
MRGSLGLGKLSGIDVFVHWSLWALLLVVGIVTFASTQDAKSVFLGTIAIVMLFGCVVLHELGHALAARRFGIPTRDITLLPIGGVARLERLPSEPKQELWIALAGPAVNLALLIAVALVGGALLGFDYLALSDSRTARACRTLLAFNAIMAVFNLLPIFPMDGGRVLRALLSMRGSAVKATQIASIVGQVLAVGLGLFGVFVLKNPLMIFMAGYLILAARRESKAIAILHETSSLEAKHAMAPTYVSVSPFENVGQATQLLYISEQRLLPISRRGDYFGSLTVERISDLYNQGLKQVPTIEVLDEDVPVVSPSDSLQVVCETMQATGFYTLPVVEGTWLIGVINRDTITTAVQSRRTKTRRITSQSREEQANANNAPAV